MGNIVCHGGRGRVGKGRYIGDIGGGECALVEGWVFDHCETVAQT